MCVFSIFLDQWRKDIRKSDDSEFGRLFVKRLNESKEEEKQRLIEQRLFEERRAAQQFRRGRGGHGPAGRGGQSAAATRGPAASGSGGGNTSNLICSWCQSLGHKIAKCRILSKDFDEGRAMYDSNLQRYIRLDHSQFVNNPPPATQARGGN